MRSKCPEPNKEGCPWQNRGGCFADSDHITPRAVAKQQKDARMRKLARRFIGLPENKQQLCRYLHDQKTLYEQDNPPSLPSEEEMRARVNEYMKERRLKRLGQTAYKEVENGEI